MRRKKWLIIGGNYVEDIYKREVIVVVRGG
jgi:hypothetical protein